MSEPKSPPPRFGIYPQPALEDPPRTRSSVRYGTMLMLALVLVAGGYAYHERARLKGYPVLLEWAITACAHLGCEAPLRRDVTRIALIERDVYASPNRPGTLTIAATLLNRARFAQPYPLVQVSFTNLQGTVVASRRLRPAEYLARAPGPKARMRPGAPVKIRAVIPDPGSAATAFEFAFF